MGYILTIAMSTCEWLVASVGAHLTFSQGGIFFLGFPVLFSLGAYSYVLAEKGGLGVLGGLLAMLVVILLMAVVYIVTYLHLNRDGFAVFTLASIMAYDALVRSWSDVTGGVLGIAGVQRPTFLTTYQDLLICGLVLVGCALLFEFLVLRSRLGRSIRGMKENPQVLASLGVAPKQLGIFLLLVTAFTSAGAGVMRAWRIQFLDPSLGGIPMVIFVLTVAILARAPKVWVLATSVVFVSLAPEVLRFLSLPAAQVGLLRSLMYTLLVIILLYWLSHKEAPKRIS